MSSGWNLGRAIVDQAEARPGLRVGTAGDDLTLADAVGLAAGRATAMLASGLQPGAPVALVAPTSTDYLVSWLACVLGGIPVALVNPTYPAQLLEQMLAPLSPARVIDADGVAEARTFGSGDPDRLPGLDADRLAPASYMHTSGTTGLPKFCAQSHEYFRRLGGAIAAALDLGPGDRVLAPLPLFHINPMGYGVITALLTGADVLNVKRFSASGFWPAVKSEAITTLILHAPPVEILKRATSGEDASGHHVRSMFYADGSFLRTFGIASAVSGYGSTEAGGISHLKRWDHQDDLPADAGRHGGRGRDDIEWRVEGDGRIELRERQPGAMFSGYVTETGLDRAVDENGWFATGDLGRVELNGDLVFLERAAESIRVKGEFVPVPYVEEQLTGLPGIRDLALWKRRGQLVDDDVVLFVVADEVPLDALRARVATLPAFMRPVVIARVSALPRDAAAGKVQRRRLTAESVIELIDL